jgi:hypothetical protein
VEIGAKVEGQYQNPYSVAYEVLAIGTNKLPRKALTLSETKAYWWVR